MFRWFIWFNTRIVIPKNYQSQILNVLHLAHQGVNSMMKRANQTVYWPGIMSSIRNMWYECQICNNIAPSQSKEPLIISKTPQYPFHYICADYFEIKGNHYLAVLDRFSSWIMIYHFPPRKLSFVAHQFQQFLHQWTVEHRLSLGEYPQSNLPNIIYDNVAPNGSLNTNAAARAILQYCNIPLPESNLSPAQVLFHRQLHDHLCKDWIISTKQREVILCSPTKPANKRKIWLICNSRAPSSWSRYQCCYPQHQKFSKIKVGKNRNDCRKSPFWLILY